MSFYRVQNVYSILFQRPLLLLLYLTSPLLIAIPSRPTDRLVAISKYNVLIIHVSERNSNKWRRV